MMLPPTMNRPPLAQDKVRFVGDIVAMVVAETKAQAVDAAEAVIVDYDPLPAVVDARSRDRRRRAGRARGAGFERRQRDGHRPGRGRARRRRRRRVAQRIVNQRVAPVPMEPAGIVAVPGEPAGGLTFWAATQGPHGVRDELAAQARPRPGGRARRATPRSAAGSAPRPGMIVEHLLVAQGRADARPAGEVDRDPLREHGRDVARPRPRARRRARAEARRHDHRPARAHDRRRGRVRRRSARSCRSSRR